ncbi:RNA polymerase sigma factor [Planctomycetes bacterium Poly30]|uniref:RNA polymerase sigma factor n=1 Tax=Saltatorellus ferox TaxID=2528018 RepID=A0A518ELT4_9BACT|nr:RNA polymerase sigma factor [Planctomycetes bacterium Poly30]
MSDSGFKNARDLHAADLAALWGEAGWLRGLALYLGCDDQAADDAVQETLLAAGSTLPSGDRGVLRGWLGTVLRRKVGMRRRSEARREFRERAVAREEALDLDPTKLIQRKELEQRLASIVADLKQQDRELIALRHAAGLTPAAIASTLGLTPNVVSARLTRIHRRIADRLEGDELSYFEGRAAGVLASLGGLIMKKSIVAVAVTLVALTAVLTLRRGVDLGPSGRPTASAPAAAVNLVDVAVLEQDLSAMGRARSPGDRVELAPASEPLATATPPELSDADAENVGTIRVRVHEAGTGLPAVGVEVNTIRFDQGVLWSKRQTCETDRDGIARLEEVPAGEFAVEAGRVGTDGYSRPHAMIRLAAGESVELEFLVDEAERVRGRVVDESGQPVSGAAILLHESTGAPEWQGTVAGYSDQDGRFEIKYVEAERNVSASKPGFAPSSTTNLRMTSALGGTEVELVLVARRGRVFGIVSDFVGAPIEGAMVALTPAFWTEAYQETAEPGRWVPGSMHRVTGSDGLFEFADVAVGPVQLSARAVDSSLVVQDANVADRGHHEIVFRLSQGGALTGRFRMPDGEPAVGIKLEVLSQPFSPMAWMVARSDESGEFELRGLGPGKVEISVQDPSGATYFIETVEFLDGQTVRWDRILEVPARFAGTLRSEGGEPLSSWSVKARSLREGVPLDSWRVGQVDPSGAFSFDTDYGTSFEVQVMAPDSWYLSPAMVLENVSPAEGPLHIVVPDTDVPRGVLMGRPCDEAGQPIEGTVEIVDRAGTRLATAAFSESEGFDLAVLDGVSLTAVLRSKGRKERRLELNPVMGEGERRDLGLITLERP